MNAIADVPGVPEVPIGKVFPNPDQPRKNFDQEKLEELSMSIRQYGVLEPIVVTPRPDGYMIIAGERRYRATLLAGLQTIPARIMEADDQVVEELALLENIQRQDLNPVEEAKAFQSLLDRGWSKQELASKMGFKQEWRVDERLSLLKLSPAHQELLVKGVIGNSQAFEMSRVSTAKQEIILKRILAGELGSYNKLRAYVDGILALEKQQDIFELQVLSDEERDSVMAFESMVRSCERLIAAVQVGERSKHMQKVVFHTDVSPERLDLIITSLQQIRKAVLSGAGIKEAIAA